MKSHPFILTIFLVIIATSNHLNAANLEKATVTEAVNDVSLIDRSTKKTGRVRVQDILFAPNFLRTGADSRAELLAADQTVTRVGQNTLFSFLQNSREINLEKGSLLFQSPSGKGGGTIQTPAASAAVLGTTLIVTTTKNGGFKVLLIEGRGRVRGSDGTTRTLNSGQMTYALPGGKLSKVFNFHLAQQVKASSLLKGFKGKLASSEKIDAAIARQEKLIKKGRLLVTNYLASGSPEYVYLASDTAIETLVNQGVEEQAETAAGQDFQTAITRDAVISGEELDPSSVFTFDGPNAPGIDPPVAIGDSPFEIASLHGSGSSDAAMFAAKSITLSTPRVNLSTYEGRSVFEFLSIDNTNFESSVDFAGLKNTELHMVAGGTFTNKPGTVISTDASNFLLAALGSSFPIDGQLTSGNLFKAGEKPLELTNFEIISRGGGLQLLGGQSFLTGLKLDAKTNLWVHSVADTTMKPGSGFSHSDLLANGVKASGANVAKAGKQLRISAGRDVSLAGFASSAENTAIIGGRTVRLQQISMSDLKSTSVFGSPIYGSSQPTIQIIGNELVDITQGRFYASDVRMQARTINLRDVSFASGSKVVLESALGLLAYGPFDPSAGSGQRPNNNLPSKPGYVNFIRNVDYGGQPAENFVNGPSDAKSGIIVTKPNKVFSGGFKP